MDEDCSLRSEHTRSVSGGRRCEANIGTPPSLRPGPALVPCPRPLRAPRTRGGALQPAEPPGCPGWGRTGLDSLTDLRRPWRTSGRTEPTVGAASGLRPPQLSRGSHGGRGHRALKALLCSCSSAPNPLPTTPAGSPLIPSREPPLPLGLMGLDARPMLRPGRSRYLGGSDAGRGRGGSANRARKRDRLRPPQTLLVQSALYTSSSCLHPPSSSRSRLSVRWGN